MTEDAQAAKPRVGKQETAVLGRLTSFLARLKEEEP